MTAEDRMIKDEERDEEPEQPIAGVPVCSLCRRERTVGTAAHPMDSYDYSLLQVVTGQPLGWYSGDDGEVCPECMTSTMRGQ